MRCIKWHCSASLTTSSRACHEITNTSRVRNLQPCLRPELPLLVYLPICCNIGKSTFCLPGPHQVVGLAPLVRVCANLLMCIRHIFIFIVAKTASVGFSSLCKTATGAAPQHGSPRITHVTRFAHPDLTTAPMSLRYVQDMSGTAVQCLLICTAANFLLFL